jgi:riboflavin kinase/FMN adenylyltransferase
MRVALGLDELSPADHPAFVVVGVFDGLHLGHAYLLRHLVAEADRRGARPMVVTFDHHPDEILTGNAPALLCDPAERLERLEAAGVATTVVVHFDQVLRQTPYEVFVARLSEHGRLAGFLMTPDAAFGYQRGGTPATLATLGVDKGFDVVVVPPFELDGHAVRSTEVRKAIAAGDLMHAARLLGRAAAVAGIAESAPADGGPPALAGECPLRFELPMMLPPVGRWSARVVRAGEPAIPAVARVADGRLWLPAVDVATASGVRVRVELLGPAG